MTKKEFQQLPLSKKADFIFWQAVAACFTIALLFCYVQKEFNINQPSLKVEMIDARQEIADEPAFSPFFLENNLSADPKMYQVHKRIQLGTDQERPACNPYQLLFCSVRSYDPDLYFWDSPDIQRMMSKNVLMDLRDFVPMEVLNRHEEQLIYTGSTLKGGYPCAVRLENNEWLEQNQYYEECAVGIARTAGHPKTAGQFLSFILK